MSCGSRRKTRECASKQAESLSSLNHALTAHRCAAERNNRVSGEHLNENVIVAPRKTEAIPNST